MDGRLERATKLEETNPDEALSLCSQVLNEDHNHPEATYIAARVLMTAGRWGMAYIMYLRCNQISPHKAEIQNSLGLACEHVDPVLALKHYDNALRINPNHYHALNNKGLMLLRKGRPDLCIKYSDKCLKIHPDYIGGNINKATALLMLRQWREGWELYQSSLGISRTKREYGAPDWNGEEGTVVVYGEQGLGDEILFASCVPDLQKTNKVILDVEPRLRSLFERSFNCPVYGTRFQDSTPLVENHHIDYQISIGSLPRFFRNSGEEFPGLPWLTPDPERCIQWRALFDSLDYGSNNEVMRRNQPNGKRIGLAWQGGILNTERHARSFDLDVFKPLFDLPHTFVSLEYDEPDLKGYPIRHFGRAVNKGVDYDETLSLISELDLVISVPTTGVHASGSVGTECWVLVPKHPSFRYHLDGDMPWYKTARLFRQTGTWDNLILEVKRALEERYDQMGYGLRRSRGGRLSHDVPLSKPSIDTTDIDSAGIAETLTPH